MQTAAQCHNGEPHPLTPDEVASLIGQDAKVVAPGDWATVRGHAHVDNAFLDGDKIALALTANLVTDDALGPGAIKLVGIGFRRTKPGQTVDLMTIAYDPGPALVPSLTDEQRRRGAEMLKQCSLEVGGDPKRPCRLTATSMVKIGETWHYRCRGDEGVVRDKPERTYGAVRPIPLVPFESDVKDADARWIIGTPWWHHCHGTGNLEQGRDFSGRDLFAVLVAAHGHDRAVALWEEACALADAKVSFGEIRRVLAYNDPAKCVEHGGHCYERGNVIYATEPSSWSEKCKHCPATRVGRVQPGVAYTYPSGRVE